MPMKSEESMLASARYSPSEAARYARVATQKLSRWIYGTSNSEPVFKPQLADDGERRVTFQDFAQALSIHDIRLNARIPLQKIRQAYQRAQTEFGVAHPFAVKHGIFVFGDLRNPARCELGILLHGNGIDTTEYVKERAHQLTGRQRGNDLISEIVQPFSKRLVFSHQGDLLSYVAWEGGGWRIVMEPDVRFGRPYIEGLGYDAETLSRAVKIEGSVERASKLFRVDAEAVKAALAFIDVLHTPPPKQIPKRIAA